MRKDICAAVATAAAAASRSDAANSRRALLRHSLSLPLVTRVPGWHGWMTALGATGVAASQARAQAAPATPITVFYRRQSDQSPSRLDVGIQAASEALQGEFARKGWRVIEPSAQVYQALDKGPEVIVSFAPDAGFSMLYSARRGEVPVPGQQKSRIEVALSCRVFIGHNLVASENATGAVVVHTESGMRQWTDGRGSEVAAQRAAESLAAKVMLRLSTLSPERISELGRLSLPAQPGFQTVPVPAQAQPAAQAPNTPAATPHTGPLPRPARKFALVVTVSDYARVRTETGLNVKDLPAVAIDRRKLTGALKANGFDQVRELSDAQATSSAVLAELGRLVRDTRPDDLVVIAFSAHGVDGNEVPSGFGRPVLSDYRHKDDGAFDFWHLQSLVGNMPARQTVLLLDTCHSGGAVGMMNQIELSSRGVNVRPGPGAADADRMAQVQRQAHGEGPGRDGRAFAVLTASGADEVSWELRGAGGLFTTALVGAWQKARGAKNLAQMYEQDIAPAVVEGSRKICRDNPQCQGKLQNPKMATSGRGGEIFL